MRKLLLLLFLLSLSSNVFADEFEKYEELQERQYMDCYVRGTLFKLSNDGQHVYWKNRRFDRVNGTIVSDLDISKEVLKALLK